MGTGKGQGRTVDRGEGLVGGGGGDPQLYPSNMIVNRRPFEFFLPQAHLQRILPLSLSAPS